MNITRLPRAVPGGIIAAPDFNQVAEAVERLGINFGPGFAYSIGPAGTTAAVRPDRVEFWAKITGHAAPGTNGSASGGSGPYAWTEQVAQKDGSWLDGFNKGTVAVHPGYEVNGSTVVPTGSIVKLRLEEGTNDWSFEFAKCGT